jgi:mono/diheme cytochrome c family protein
MPAGFTGGFLLRLLLILAAVMSLAARATVAAVPSGFKYWNPEDTATIPKTLTAMGLYPGAPGKNATLIDQAKYYEVNAPLWSDDAKKKRWVIVKPGKTIGFRVDDDYWTYPDSTVFVKEFAIDTVPGDTNTRVLWETRILYLKKQIWDSTDGHISLTDKWYGYSYKWDGNQKEARLLPIGGSDDQIRFYPDGLKQASRMKKWSFPSRYVCDRCHLSNQSDTIHGRSVLGFFTAQLNRPAPKAPAMNQLDWLISQGVLSGAKPATWDAAPRWRGLEDSAFTSDKWTSLDVRARSYIGANCSGCHGNRGGMLGAYNSNAFNYDYFNMTPQMEFRNHWVGWDHGVDANDPQFWPASDAINNPLRKDSLVIDAKLVIAGYPSKSVLLQRQKTRNTAPDDFGGSDQMPPYATFEVNPAAIALLEKWILAMPAQVEGAVRPHGAPRAGAAVRLQGRRLEVTTGPGSGPEAVSLISREGRRLPLRRIGEGVYELPSELSRGVFFIRVGNQGFVLNRF